jgi:pseudaminic acid cytidylyltransferase
MTRLAIIPARGGSKRIPRKNIRNFFGKPIIAYSIEIAHRSGLFDEVMVSTDDEEIGKVAKSYGASVPFMRSARNADDFATTMDVLKEVEADYKTKLNRSFDYICCIYPTAPLIKKERLIAGLNTLFENNLDAVFPIVPFSYPIWRGLEIVDDKIKMLWPDFLNSRSQDLKKAYHDAGQWYWYRPEKIDKTLFTENASSIILDEMEVQDIDTLSDWLLAEMKYKFLNETSDFH